MFCPNCGNEFENVGGVCPYCNAVVENAAPLTTEAPAKANKNKLFLLIGGGVALVLVIVLVFALFGGGAEGVAEDYVESSADYDMESLFECTPVNLDFDELCERAKPIDADDYDGDSESAQAMRKALREADADDFAEVYELYLQYQAEADYDGYEVSIENVRTRISDEVSKSDEGFAERLASYNSTIESLQKQLGANRDLLEDATVSLSDVSDVQRVYIAYEIDSEEEGSDRTRLSSYYVAKVDGSWKVISASGLNDMLFTAGLFESSDDQDFDLY